MSPKTSVTRLYEEFKELSSYLEENGELSFQNTTNENFRKSLLLAAASHFEHLIIENLKSFMEEIITENSYSKDLLINFLKNKAINRQYHTFFEWKEEKPSGANCFFALFGQDFKNHMKQLVKNDDTLTEAIKSFLEIGRERNELVHNDFSTFALDKTTKEIYKSYEKASLFIERFFEELHNYSSREN